jgi:quercetin dioxygenase-like cupin family protein
MEISQLENMFKGWFIGDFEPSLYKTNNVEVGVKYYKEGDYEPSHFHKIATEFTVILDGRVEMNGNIYESGSILKILPNESTDFKALTNVKTVVVKIPGASNDKYQNI